MHLWVHTVPKMTKKKNQIINVSIPALHKGTCSSIFQERWIFATFPQNKNSLYLWNWPFIDVLFHRDSNPDVLFLFLNSPFPFFRFIFYSGVKIFQNWISTYRANDTSTTHFFFVKTSNSFYIFIFPPILRYIDYFID